MAPSRASVTVGLALELGVDADRDVVGDHRHVDRRPDIAEVVDDLGLAGAGVEGRGDDDGVDAGGLRGSGMADHPVGGRIDDAGEDRHAAVHHLRPCARGSGAASASSWKTTSLVEPSTNRPWHAALDQVLEHPGVGRIVDLEVSVEGRDDGGHDAARTSALDTFLAWFS